MIHLHFDLKEKDLDGKLWQYNHDAMGNYGNITMIQGS